MTSTLENEPFTETIDAPKFIFSRVTPFSLTVITCACAIGVLALPMFAGHVYTADDLGAFHLPLRAFYSQQLAAGESWDWIPSLFGGFYLTGEGQLGGYHPLHLLLYKFLPVGLAFDLELLLSYPAMLIGGFLLLRRLVNNRLAALMGAACFTFGGFSLLHFIHPNAIAVVAHIPWLLWLVDRLMSQRAISRERIGCLIAIAILTGSEILLGYPQYVWFSLVAELAIALTRMRISVLSAKLAAILVAAKLIGLSLGAIQLLPTLDALHDSTRVVVDNEFSAIGSLHPLNAVQLVAPYLFEHRVVGQNTHELGLYFGAVPCVLCCWLLLQPKVWGSDRRPILTLIAGLIVALLLAFGQFAPIYPLQQFLPFVNRFRFPCRSIVLVQLALAALTALAVKRLMVAQRDHTQKTLKLPSLVPVATSVVLAIVGPWIWSVHVASRTLLWTGPALFAAATFLFILAHRDKRFGLSALVVFAIGDAVVYGASYSVVGRTMPIDQYIAAAPRRPNNDGTRVVADLSVAQDPLEVGNSMLLSGVHRLDGYAGLEPHRLLDYSDKDQLRLAGVGWIYNSQRPTDPWTELAAPLPRFRLVSQTTVGNSFATCSAKQFASSALVDTKLELPASASGSVIPLVDRPGHIEMATEAAGTQLLVITESYHDGWQATVDGQDVPVLRVNRDFLGCVVPGGRRTVHFRFSPFSLRLGKGITACGLGLCVIATVFAWCPWPGWPTRYPKQHSWSD